MSGEVANTLTKFITWEGMHSETAPPDRTLINATLRTLRTAKYPASWLPCCPPAV